MAARPTQPPEAKVFLATRYRSIDSLRELPREVAAGLERHLHGAPVADRGESFRSGDVVTDPDPPVHRFLWAGTSPTGSVVVYEHGGLGLHYHLVLFTPGAPVAPVLAHCRGVMRRLPPAPREIYGKKQAAFSRLVERRLARELRAGACTAADASFDF